MKICPSPPPLDSPQWGRRWADLVHLYPCFTDGVVVHELSPKAGFVGFDAERADTLPKAAVWYGVSPSCTPLRCCCRLSGYTLASAYFTPAYGWPRGTAK